MFRVKSYAKHNELYFRLRGVYKVRRIVVSHKSYGQKEFLLGKIELALSYFLYYIYFTKTKAKTYRNGR